MYCIVQVVYGVPVRQTVLDELEKLGLEPEDVGITTLYSGGADETPAYCGVALDEFDEATDMALVANSIRHAPTGKEVAEALAKIAALPSSVSEKIKEKINTYYVFCTS